MLRHRDRVTTLGSRSQGRARLKVVPTRRGEICGFQPLCTFKTREKQMEEHGSHTLEQGRRRST